LAVRSFEFRFHHALQNKSIPRSDKPTRRVCPLRYTSGICDRRGDTDGVPAGKKNNAT
jgi:hypothetical protein